MHTTNEVTPLNGAPAVVSETQQTFALAESADAHRALESRKTNGATVLVA